MSKVTKTPTKKASDAKVSAPKKAESSSSLPIKRVEATPSMIQYENNRTEVRFIKIYID